jgi:hypothetical protein
MCGVGRWAWINSVTPRLRSDYRVNQGSHRGKPPCVARDGAALYGLLVATPGCRAGTPSRKTDARGGGGRGGARARRGGGGRGSCCGGRHQPRFRGGPRSSIRGWPGPRHCLSSWVRPSRARPSRVRLSRPVLVRPALGEKGHLLGELIGGGFGIARTAGGQAKQVGGKWSSRPSDPVRHVP